MTGSLPDPPELEPTALSGTNFGRARRGFEPTEVRSMLGRAADALRVWAERDAKLAERIADLSKRLDAAEEFDEARVTELLGAETARIVAAARDAASEIRGQAQKESTELIDRSRSEAEAAAAELREAATVDRAEAAKVRSEAAEAASRMVAEATAEADRTLTEARAEADSLRENTREKAERVSAEAAEAAEKLTSEAQARHDEMIEAAGKVLDERTATAEAAASEIRSTASEELEHARATASEELQRAREEARSIVQSAEAEADTRREEARVQGREMVEEARELRRQMLRDIADRARAGRQKVEAAKAARAEVLRAIRAVGGELDDAVAVLSDHDQAMRKAADAAAAAVPDDIELVVKELEDQLMTVPTDTGTLEVESQESGTGPEPLSTGADVTEPDVAEPDVAEPGVTEPDDGVLRPVASVQTGDSDPEHADDSESSDDSDSEDGGSDGSQMASVHDLFEKLRSDGTPSPRDVHPGGRGPNSVGGVDAPEDLATPTASMGVIGVATLTEAPDAEAPDDEPSGDAGPPSEMDRVGTDPGGVSLADEHIEARSDGENENGPQAILDRRDELLEPAEKLLGRALKRLLSDEQNEVLDRVRRHKRSRIEIADLLGEEDVIDDFTSKLSDAYAAAAMAGAKMWAGLSGDVATESKDIDVTDALVTEALESQVAELLGLRRAQLREVLEAHSEAGADPGELVDSLRSAYRDLRTSSVDELAGDLATGGFAAGTAVAAGPSAVWRWVADNGGLPCADAEDNALEGPVACGAAFPTGDTRPPAHPGCRCIVVPADVEGS
jgi:cell division septum initiation protein DivIVA